MAPAELAHYLEFNLLALGCPFGDLSFVK